MITYANAGESVLMEYDIVGHDDDTTERVQRSLEAITKDMKLAIFSDGTALPVQWVDADGDDVENFNDAVYIGGGNEELGYFTVLAAPLRYMTFH